MVPPPQLLLPLRPRLLLLRLPRRVSCLRSYHWWISRIDRFLFVFTEEKKEEEEEDDDDMGFGLFE